jgi:hypothetical protein
MRGDQGGSRPATILRHFDASKSCCEVAKLNLARVSSCYYGKNLLASL